MPRDTLLGLLNSTSKNERITAPIPIPTLTELLGDDAPRGTDPAVVPEPQVVVRFTPKPGTTPVVAPMVARSHWIIALSATATLMIGLVIIFFA